MTQDALPVIRSVIDLTSICDLTAPWPQNSTRSRVPWMRTWAALGATALSATGTSGSRAGKPSSHVTRDTEAFLLLLREMLLRYFYWSQHKSYMAFLSFHEIHAKF